MEAIKKLLPLPAAYRLAQAGIDLPTLYGYVYNLKDPNLTTSLAALIKSFDNDGFPDIELGLDYCPAPDFAELWPALPVMLKAKDVSYPLQLSGWSFGFVASYSTSERVLLASSAETPIEAAGNLLLQLFDKFLVTADHINRQAQLIAAT